MILSNMLSLLTGMESLENLDMRDNILGSGDELGDNEIVFDGCGRLRILTY
mgnify:CR=1 FL=1